jgi:CRISPR-associated protein Cmr6
MTAPLYKPLPSGLGTGGPSAGPPAACNLGLWYTRFFDGYSGDGAWRVENDAKRFWIQRAVEHSPVASLVETLEAHARRRIGLTRAIGGDLVALQTCWHFVTGLGLPHPVENGFAWHPTLGLPYLPASGIKGLLGAWLHTLEEDEDQTTEAKQEAARRRGDWCGKEDDAGLLIFFDALPTKPPVLAVDVMTPHMGQWYADGGGVSDPDREPQKVPADWHSPVPVPFLVVKQATFLFGIAPRPGADWGEKDPASEVDAALRALEEALAVLGAGAKTAVGYGRFETARSILDELRREEAEAARAKTEEDSRAAELARFDGFDPPVAELAGGGDPGGFAARLLAAMERGVWTREACRELAARLREWLDERGDWVKDAKSRVEKATKDKRVKRTLDVMRWLDPEA